MTPNFLFFLFLASSIGLCSAQRRIVIEGQFANKSKHNWFVNIWPDNSRPRPDLQICGGGILTELYVITSARCIAPFERNPSELIVTTEYRLADNVDFRPDGSHREPHPVGARVFVSDDYSVRRTQLVPGDVGILRVNPRFTFSPLIGPLPPLHFPNETDLYEIPSNMVICGVGARYWENPTIYHNHVRCRHAVTITPHECAFTGGFRIEDMDERFFCTRQGACRCKFLKI